MYICEVPGQYKKMLKIQSKKNHHIINGYPCENYYELPAKLNDNPCRRDSFVDLDKKFLLNGIEVPLMLRTEGGLSPACYTNILSQIDQYVEVDIPVVDFLQVNPKCRKREC